jgi:hypothetical protein
LISLSFIANYCNDNQRNLFIFLVIFHALLSIFLFGIANSEFLLGMHDGNGFWHFARDVETYHNEAVFSLEPLENNEWHRWWNFYPGHKHVRFASLLYWVTGYSEPIVYEIINSFTWATSVILIYKTSNILFSEDTKVSLLTISFFFFPTLLLQSTQMLRDPLFMLGFCILCYSFVKILKENQTLNQKLKLIIIIQIGLVLIISMRDYLSPIFLIGLLVFAVLAYFQKKLSIIQLFLLVLPLIAFENLTVNKHLKEPTQLSIYNQEIILQQAKTILSDEEIINQGMYDQISTINKKAITNLKINDRKRKQAIDLQQFYIRYQIKKINEAKELLDKATENLDIDSIERANGVIKNARAKQTISVILQRKINAEFLLHEFLINKNQAIALKKLQLIIPDESFLSKNLNTISRNISTLRFGFKNYVNAGSKIDEAVLFSNFNDIVAYLPRSIQVGLFAPFPLSWNKKGSQVGKIGSVLSGFEMIVWYISLIGFIYVFCRNSYLMLPLMPAFMLSIIAILLISYAIPNIGTIYRMRQPYMIPFYIYGVYGLSLIYISLTKKNV